MDPHVDGVLDADVVMLSEGERLLLAEEVSEKLCKLDILPFAEFDDVYDTVIDLVYDSEYEYFEELVIDTDIFELRLVDTDTEINWVSVDLLLDDGDIDDDFERKDEEDIETDLDDDTLDVRVLLYVLHEDSDIKGLTVKIYDGLLDILRLPVEEPV